MLVAPDGDGAFAVRCAPLARRYGRRGVWRGGGSHAVRILRGSAGDWRPILPGMRTAPASDATAEPTAGDASDLSADTAGLPAGSAGRLAIPTRVSAVRSASADGLGPVRSVR